MDRYVSTDHRFHIYFKVSSSLDEFRMKEGNPALEHRQQHKDLNQHFNTVDRTEPSDALANSSSSPNHLFSPVIPKPGLEIAISHGDPHTGLLPAYGKIQAEHCGHWCSSILRDEE
jgi:hypothetical protein